MSNKWHFRIIPFDNREFMWDDFKIEVILSKYGWDCKIEKEELSSTRTFTLESTGKS